MTTTRKRTGWAECSKAHPCAGCGHTDGWCSVSADGTASLCRRGAESAHPVKQKDGSTAYLHATAAGAAAAGRAKPAEAKPRPDRLKETELRRILKAHRLALSSGRLAACARSLGLDESALVKFGAGWDDERQALSFPMYDGAGKPCGVRLRAESGRKMCVPGSANGLFLPDDFDVAAAPDPFEISRFSAMVILTPEGPTDSAAAWQVGFAAVGRPSCTGGGHHVATLLRRCREAGAPRDVVVVADTDATHWHDRDNVPYWPGWEGALALAADVLPHAAGVRVVKPPPGAKDLRQILKSPPPAMADDPVRELGTALVCAVERADADLEKFGGVAKWLAFQRTLLVEVKAVCKARLTGRKPDAGARAEAEAFARELARTRKAAEWLERQNNDRRRAG